MLVPPIVKYRTLGMAKSFTPIDTGNLRHNAVHLRKVKSDSWSITYDTSNAYYVEILEDGTLSGATVKGRKPKKFISRTSLVLARYLRDYYAGKPTSKWAGQRLRRALASSEDNVDRQNRNKLSNFESQNKIGNIKWR
jgi:hypothetical protein